VPRCAYEQESQATHGTAVVYQAVVLSLSGYKHLQEAAGVTFDVGGLPGAPAQRVRQHRQNKIIIF
jgi:hypothetical protein